MVFYRHRHMARIFYKTWIYDLDFQTLGFQIWKKKRWNKLALLAKLLELVAFDLSELLGYFLTGFVGFCSARGYFLTGVGGYFLRRVSGFLLGGKSNLGLVEQIHGCPRDATLSTFSWIQRETNKWKSIESRVWEIIFQTFQFAQ